MINISQDKFDKVSCAMMAMRPAKKVCCQSEFLVYSFFVVHRYPYRGSRYSPPKLLSFLTPRHLGHFARRDVCASATESR